MKISKQIYNLEKKLASIKKSDVKIQLVFENSAGTFKEIIDPEDLSIDTILSLIGKHYSKKFENFDVDGKPFVGVNGDFVELFVNCNWKDDLEARALIVVKIRFDKMFDKIIKVLG